MKTFKIILLLAILGAFSGAALIYSGFYPIGADVPHNKLTYWVLEQVREKSIGRASSDIKVPDLNSPEMLLSGGADYNAMCTSCHMKTGETESDMSQGLYPQPPNLTLVDHEGDHDSNDEQSQAQRWFWIIKHGIKASGMPAWGKTHDDKRIWAMVAFLQKLPELTEYQYQILTAQE